MAAHDPLHSIQYNGNAYRVQDLIDASKHKSIEETAVTEFAWMDKYLKLDKDKVQSANIAVPIIGIKQKIGAFERIVILDGKHRYARLLRTKAKTIPIRYLTEHELHALLQ